MLVLKTIWAFVKKYWALIALVVAAILMTAMGLGTKLDFASKLKAIQDAHDAELKKIDDARAEEQHKNDENLKQLQDALTAVQKQYDTQRQQLDEKKKAEIEQIVKDYGDDPVLLAKKLSEATGFEVIMP